MPQQNAATSIALGALFLLIGCASQKPTPAPPPSSKRTPAASAKPTFPVGPTEPTDKFFKDVTTKIGLAGALATRLYAADFDSDGHTDIILLPEAFSVPQFYRFDPAKVRFTKLRRSPLPFRVSFLALADFNKDGILDILTGTFNQKTAFRPRPLRIFKGLPQIHYQEIPDAFPGKPTPASSVSLLDFDLDGELDVFVGNWYDLRQKNSPPVSDQLFRGKAFKFTERGDLLTGEYQYNHSLKAYTNARPTFGVSVCDIDQNGYPDLLTANSSGHGNRLWLSRKEGQTGERIFKDVGPASAYLADNIGIHAARGGGNSTYTKCADYNNDGAMDVAVGEITRSFDGEERDLSSVLTGTSRHFPIKFLRSEYLLIKKSPATWNQGDHRGVWLDYNGDSLQDLLVDNSGFPPHSRLILFEQLPDHAMEDHAEKMGINVVNPAGTITLDFNRDGRMDFISGQTSVRNANIPRRVYAFANTTAPSGRSLRFYLRGRKANVQGLGGMVLLKTDQSFYRQAVDSLYGPQPSQNEEGHQFFLPKEEKLEFVEVRWPIHQRDRGGRLFPLVRTYKLKVKHLKGKGLKEFTLCENGKWFAGRGALLERRCLK